MGEFILWCGVGPKISRIHEAGQSAKDATPLG